MALTQREAQITESQFKEAQNLLNSSRENNKKRDFSENREKSCENKEKTGKKNDDYARNGARYMRIGGPFYRPWASKSDLGEKYIHCKWCQSDFLAKNTVGKQGHEKTSGHKIKAEEYQKNKIKFQNNIEKNRNVFPSLSEKAQKVKLFGYKFINLCLGFFFFLNFHS
jgi:hypothetical protein